MDIADHFQIIWRRRLAVVLASLLVAGLVFAWRNSQPRVYRATAVLSVTKGRSAGDTVTQTEAQFLAQSYGALATTLPRVAQAERSAVPPLGISAVDAKARISVDTTTSPGFINLSTTGPSPEQAQAFTKATADVLVSTVKEQQASQKSDLVDPIQKQIDALQAEIAVLPAGSAQRAALTDSSTQLRAAKTTAELRPVDVVQVVSPSRAANGPVSPKPIRDTLLVFILALIVNSELAVALEVFSDRFSASDEGDEVARVTGLPVLAHIPRGSEDDFLEEIRTLRTNLMFTSSAESLRTVAVVSVETGSGKTFTSEQLAVSVAGLEIPVLLVDGDMRRPSLHERFGVARAPGLSDVLRGAPVEEAAVNVSSSPGMRLLAAGSPVVDAAGLLGGNALRNITSQLGWVELVLVDTPASSFFADAFAIASQCDATLIVINARKSRRRAVRKLIEQLRQVNATPIGVVVNLTGGGSRSAQYYSSKRSPAASRRI